MCLAKCLICNTCNSLKLNKYIFNSCSVKAECLLHLLLGGKPVDTPSLVVLKIRLDGALGSLM